jgi:hypothetical protein
MITMENVHENVAATDWQRVTEEINELTEVSVVALMIFIILHRHTHRKEFLPTYH